MPRLSKHNDGWVMRVRRETGQPEPVERALVHGEDCAKPLLLTAAVRGALNGLIDELIEDHLRTLVGDPHLPPAEREGGLQSVLMAIRRYAK